MTFKRTRARGGFVAYVAVRPFKARAPDAQLIRVACRKLYDAIREEDMCPEEWNMLVCAVFPETGKITLAPYLRQDGDVEQARLGIVFFSPTLCEKYTGIESLSESAFEREMRRLRDTYLGMLAEMLRPDRLASLRKSANRIGIYGLREGGPNRMRKLA